jgi:hypothetical protein
VNNQCFKIPWETWKKYFLKNEKILPYYWIKIWKCKIANFIFKIPSCTYGNEDILSHWRQIQCKMRRSNVQKLLVYFFVISFRFSVYNLDCVIHFAESFTWKELPIRDPDTGSLTMRGYIVRISSFTKLVWAFMAVFHVTQSAYRMLSSHAMIFTTWYPFDASVSPLYEIANFSQVSLNL